MGAIQKLYRMERRAKEAGLSPEARVELRRAEAAPILEILLVLSQDLSGKVLPDEDLVEKETVPLERGRGNSVTKRTTRAAC